MKGNYENLTRTISHKLNFIDNLIQGSVGKEPGRKLSVVAIISKVLNTKFTQDSIPKFSTIQLNFLHNPYQGIHIIFCKSIARIVEGTKYDQVINKHNKRKNHTFIFIQGFHNKIHNESILGKGGFFQQETSSTTPQ